MVFSLIFISFLFLSNYPGYTNDYNPHLKIAVSGKAAFVESVLTTDIDGPFDNSPLVELCKSREWIPGLIFKCKAPQGGVGNVRNVFLNCVRYAIEVGGEFSITTSLIPEPD